MFNNYQNLYYIYVDLASYLLLIVITIIKSRKKLLMLRVALSNRTIM